MIKSEQLRAHLAMSLIVHDLEKLVLAAVLGGIIVFTLLMLSVLVVAF